MLKLVCLLLVTLTSASLISGAEKWDHFVFAQAWPPGTCADAPRAHHTCSIGNGVETWTIHGLWPSLGETKGPSGCDNSLQFNFDKISSLKSELLTYWPNLYSDTPLDSFWEHEWDKHGTCCADLQTTSGEHNYFATGLMMNKKYNMSQILRQSNIVPSDTTQYSYDDFVGAIKNATGFEPVLQCTTREKFDINGQKSTYHLIDQIQICLDKNFMPISCYNTYSGSGSKYNSQKSRNDSFPVGLNGDVVGRKRSDDNSFEDSEINSNSIIRRSHHHHHQTAKPKYVAAHTSEPQSTCSTTYKFHYPPIQPTQSR